ncbi:Arylacetamide deacetylase-like 2 [Saguinus oedipus]|uniref:Arylacetamide deacetylase-like 2 n=1 Tax=Saguinus oedipus TaxID=9490 RepID=A0ABQ9U292_SAGOE|nr:Arylacetamide deacetylase-like 2 [Saguinus oedipus]
MGIMRYEEFISMIFRLDYTQPLSDEYITVTDTTFADIPVRLYLPKRKSETRRRADLVVNKAAADVTEFAKLLSQDM